MKPTHLSYSQYFEYTRCPRSWYLNKVRGGEQRQAWYTAVGSAVHQMIEDYLKPGRGPDLPPAESYFYPIISAQMEIEPDTSKWLHGGSPEAPVVEDRALRLVKDCFDRALDFLEDFEAWEVEYDATGMLPGCEVPIKAFVDLIGEHKKHGNGIVDWKTGKQKPKDGFQLETYKALLQDQGFGHAGNMVEFNAGMWAMLNPEASKPRKPVDLFDVDPAEVGAKYQKVYEDMCEKLYYPQQGYNCRMCFQQDNCIINSGYNERTTYYDRSEDDGYPF